ncbi:hypothetical protein GCM10009117_08650 [Gangjinia marincola]|uniref:DUF4251 domain-containing protein n=1 Tax=Gangjinia marincola TaxID=578463 RepID=A0ABN1MF77_9FLAO
MSYLEYMLKNFVSSIVCIVAFIACAPKMSLADREKAHSEHIEQLKEGALRIEINTAYPFQTNAVNQVSNVIWQFTGNTANRVIVSGSGDFIEIKNDTLHGDLSYIGERQISSPYSSTDIGIRFNSVPREFEIIEDSHHKFIELVANISDRIENYDIRIRLYPTGNASAYINSSLRTPIRYDGIIVKSNDSESTEKS